ncbi:hypothetical protein ACOSP7_023100 [Xanthoceras sorbifolium]
MAEILSMYKCLILVALIACNAILSTEGRQMKFMNKKEANSAMGKKSEHQGSSSSIHSIQTIEGKKQIFPPPTMSLGDSKASYKDDFRPTTPGISPGVGHSFAHQPNAESKLVSDKAGHFVTGAKDDFRPTAPGISPGVGHSFAQHQSNAESQLVYDKARHFVTGAKDDFRPTAPGHSPGVGHSFAQHQTNAESKLVSDKAGYSVTEAKDNFRPTTPGHSPGVGHAFGNKNAEPNA